MWLRMCNERSVILHQLNKWTNGTGRNCFPNQHETRFVFNRRLNNYRIEIRDKRKKMRKENLKSFDEVMWLLLRRSYFSELYFVLSADDKNGGADDSFYLLSSTLVDEKPSLYYCNSVVTFWAWMSPTMWYFVASSPSQEWFQKCLINRHHVSLTVLSLFSGGFIFACLFYFGSLVCSWFKRSFFGWSRFIQQINPNWFSVLRFVKHCETGIWQGEWKQVYKQIDRLTCNVFIDLNHLADN